MPIPDAELVVCLGFLIATAVSLLTVAAFRFRGNLLKRQFTETLQTGDALTMPITGSVVLFSIYVVLRFVPKEYFNVMISFYLSLVSIFALGSFLERYWKPNMLTGAFCVAVGAGYFLTKNWIANNVLAFAIGVTALEMVPINNFVTSYILLCGLFFYDIFWVFGSDVMITVATGIDGPIKMVFPKTIFGDHSSKSLLGLGDMIVPGFFICQTLVFSRDVAKRGNFYFIVAITAYFCSLVNTMVVMVVFMHGQPALLFIVPWLLSTFTCAVVYKGDVKLAWNYDALEVGEPITDSLHSAEETKEFTGAEEEEGSLLGMFGLAVSHLFGFDQNSSIEATKDPENITKKND